MSEQKTATINTIQHTAYVKRICIPNNYQRQYTFYIPYDEDNLYPNKIKTILERSTTLSSAVSTHSDFLSGQGFGEKLNEIIVNEDGTTLQELLNDKATDASVFKGLALHFNYDRLGRIVEVQDIPFEGVKMVR